MSLRLFVSFEHRDKDRAIWLRDNLGLSNCSVTIEDDFGASSPRVEMSRAIQDSDIVVSIVTPNYAECRAAQKELDLAEAFGKQVIALFAGLPSRNKAAAPYAAYRRLEVDGEWTGSADQWAAILAQLRTALRTELDRMARGDRPRLDEDAALLVREAVLIYDIEDRVLAHQLLRTRSGWSQSGRVANVRSKDHLTRVLLWTAASAQGHSLVRREYDEAPPGVPTFLLICPAAPAPPAGILAVPVERLLATATPRSVGAAQGAGDARADVQSLIMRASELNQNCSLDVFAERFCGSSEAADLAKDAYELAVQELHEGDALRLEAVYTHALALRFYGDWRVAVEVIDSELDATPGALSTDTETLRLRLRLEAVMLKYELGDRRADGVEGIIQEIQHEFRRVGDLRGYVQSGRALGNVLRAQGTDSDSAERALQRAVGVAEYLAEDAAKGAPGQLLLADCHRELAGLYIARHDIIGASKSLADARELLNPDLMTASSATRYLSAVLDYVDATLAQRDGVLVKATTPTEQAESALRTLARFDNPIRVAGVYNWLGSAWARQIPRRREDLVRAQEYIQKALRIRQEHGNVYACGLSYLSLGELYEAAGDLDKSIECLNASREIFNRRGLPRALAKAHAALARAYFRKALLNNPDATVLYRDQLKKAEERYREVQLENEGIELRYELEHGGRRPVGAVPGDTPLIAVGEYFLHRWIRDRATSRNAVMDQHFELVVGIGDDAAVVACNGVEPDHCLVYTTDSAPGSLSDLSKPPEYAGRFAVIQTLADILAMGAQPAGLLVNIFLSRDASVGYARRLVDAVIGEAGRYGVTVLGGDIKERSEQSVGCVGIGCVMNTRILTRSAARPGQAVAVTLASSPDGGTRYIGARWAQELIEHYNMARPHVLDDFPELAGVIDPNIKSDLLYIPSRVMASAVRTGHLRAAIDTSDGVLACLEIIARESNVGFELDEVAIDGLIDDRARRLAEVLEIPPAMFLFSAGHDWEILFTCEESTFGSVAEAVQNDLAGNGRVARIGKVVEAADQDRRGVAFRRLDRSTTLLPYYTDEKFVPKRYQDRPAQWLGFASRLGVVRG